MDEAIARERRAQRAHHDAEEARRAAFRQWSDHRDRFQWDGVPFDEYPDLPAECVPLLRGFVASLTVAGVPADDLSRERPVQRVTWWQRRRTPRFESVRMNGWLLVIKEGTEEGGGANATLPESVGITTDGRIVSKRFFVEPQAGGGGERRSRGRWTGRTQPPPSLGDNSALWDPVRLRSFIARHLAAAGADWISP